MWQDWVNVILGIWLIIAGFIPSITASKGASLWNDLIVGIIVLILAAWVAKSRWPEWINVILGIWLIIAAFIPSIVASKSGNMWNDIIVGILIVIFGIWAALMKPSQA